MAVVGTATGKWGWATGGAALGAATGYLYDPHRQKDERAYERGRRDGQAK